MLDLALIGQVLLWLLVILAFAMSGQASLYHPLTIYLGFHALVFIIRPMLVHWFGFDAMWHYIGFEPSDDNFLRGLEVSSIALLAFAASCLACGWCITKFPQQPPEPFTRKEVIALLITTVLLSQLITRSILTGFSGGATGERVGGTYILTGASGYTVEAQYMIGPLICAWLAVTRFRWEMLVLVAAYLVYRSYGGWSRWTILLSFLAISLIYAWQRRIKWPPTRVVLCAVPVLVIFNVLGHNRDFVQDFLRGEATVNSVSRPGITPIEKLRGKYDGPDFANFDFLTFVTAVVPDRTGTFTYGSQYLQLFTEPIPRKLWTGKPIGAPVALFSLNNYGNFTGMTVTVAGDGWMSGGWIGLIITLSIIGAALGRLHRRFWKLANENLASVFYLVGLAMVPQWYRDGGISVAKFLFWNLAPLILWRAAIWATNGCHFPVHSVLLTPGTKLRFIKRPARRSAQTFFSEH